MIVVSDTSPLLNLARINRLEILPSLYQRVLIPSAVYGELAASLPEQPAAIRFDSISWITVASAKDGARVQELLGDLDAGELCWRLSPMRIYCLSMKDADAGLLQQQV